MTSRSPRSQIIAPPHHAIASSNPSSDSHAPRTAVKAPPASSKSRRMIVPVPGIPAFEEVILGPAFLGTWILLRHGGPDDGGDDQRIFGTPSDSFRMEPVQSGLSVRNSNPPASSRWLFSYSRGQFSPSSRASRRRSTVSQLSASAATRLWITAPGDAPITPVRRGSVAQ